MAAKPFNCSTTRTTIILKNTYYIIRAKDKQTHRKTIQMAPFLVRFCVLFDYTMSHGNGCENIPFHFPPNGPIILKKQAPPIFNHSKKRRFLLFIYPFSICFPLLGRDGLVGSFWAPCENTYQPPIQTPDYLLLLHPCPEPSIVLPPLVFPCSLFVHIVPKSLVFSGSCAAHSYYIAYLHFTRPTANRSHQLPLS